MIAAKSQTGSETPSKKSMDRSVSVEVSAIYILRAQKKKNVPEFALLLNLRCPFTTDSPWTDSGSDLDFQNQPKIFGSIKEGIIKTVIGIMESTN